MKTPLYLLLGIALMISACKKEPVISDSKAGISDEKVSSLIRNFKKTGSSGLKSTWEVSPDSAIWYLGATANYTYGDASRETENTWTDTCLISIPLTDNMKVTANVLFSKYESIIDSLRNFYREKQAEEKQLISVSVTPSNYTPGNLVCKISALFAYGPIQVSCYFNNIDSYCFWYYWQYRPICDGPNVNSTEITDAALETQRRIMRCKGVPMGNYYYESQEEIIILDPTDYPIGGVSGQNMNHRFAHLYWNSSQYPDFDGCIPPDDLNFYLEKTRELINNYETEGGIRPAGKGLISIEMWGTESYKNDYLIYMHNANLTYGILRLSPDPRGSLN
jgi:hypothetical protein